MPKLSQHKPPKELIDLQRLMSRAIMRPLTSKERIQPHWIDGSRMSAVAKNFIKPNDRLSSLERLQIYNQQYWYRVLACFSDDFPGLRAVLGSRKFDKLAQAYLEEHPSTSFTLRNLGSQLGCFLYKHPELIIPYEELALEMFHLEWAHIEAFDAEELPGVKSSQFHLGLSLQPYISLLKLNYPVDEIILRFKEKEMEGESMSNAVNSSDQIKRRRVAIQRAKTPIFLAVHRVDYSVYYKRLEPDAYRVLHALRYGMKLEDACLQVLEENSTLTPEQLAKKVHDWFATWTRLGWLCIK